MIAFFLVRASASPHDPSLAVYFFIVSCKVNVSHDAIHFVFSPVVNSRYI